MVNRGNLIVVARLHLFVFIDKQWKEKMKKSNNNYLFIVELLVFLKLFG